MHANRNPESSLEAAAAQWLARRDRGLTAPEQDAYLQWLRESPQHGATIARLEQSWVRLDQLTQWHPAHSSQPNPDLLAPPRRRHWIPVALSTLAAAIIVGGAVWWSLPTPAIPQHRSIIHPGPQRMTLDDGSIVELNSDAKVDVAYTTERRGVRLIRGEAHFIVAKNPARPFVVSADGIAVKAVGTAFDVHLNEEAISVLVTEGKVQLDQVTRNIGSAPHDGPRLVAGQIATVRRHAQGDAAITIREVTPTETESELAWRAIRLEFRELPLRDVIAEFNRYNTRRLVLGDETTGDILVGGSFRADNVDPFVRLLDVGFGVSAEVQGDQIILRRHK